MITQERLRELAHYCPETGVFTRLVNDRFKKVGKVAGSLRKDGYIYIMFDRQRALAHRFAWLYMTGKWPTQEIDHIDGNKANNAFANLREVDRRINAENQRHAKRTSKTGLLGVRVHRNKFAACIVSSGRIVYLGMFDTPDAAHQAYLNAKRELHQGCTI